MKLTWSLLLAVVLLVSCTYCGAQLPSGPVVSDATTAEGPIPWKWPIQNISNSPQAKDQTPRINSSGWVVWQSGPSPGLGRRGSETAEVWVSDGTRNVQMTQNEVADFNPDVSDAGWIVWVGPGKTRTDVRLWNGTSVVRLGEGCAGGPVKGPSSPRIARDGSVVWEGKVNKGYLWSPRGLVELGSVSRGVTPDISDTGWAVWKGGTVLKVWSPLTRTITRLDLQGNRRAYVHRINDTGYVVAGPSYPTTAEGDIYLRAWATGVTIPVTDGGPGRP